MPSWSRVYSTQSHSFEKIECMIFKNFTLFWGEFKWQLEKQQKEIDQLKQESKEFKEFMKASKAAVAAVA